MKDKEITNVILVENLSQHQDIKRPHVKTIHDGQKDHECEFCDRSFAMAGDLKRHIKQSTSQWS